MANNKPMAVKTGKEAAGLRAVNRRFDGAAAYAGIERRRQPRRAMAIRTLRP